MLYLDQSYFTKGKIVGHSVSCNTQATVGFEVVVYCVCSDFQGWGKRKIKLFRTCKPSSKVSGPEKISPRGHVCQTVAASSSVPSGVWEDSESMMVKEHFLLVCTASLLGQKQLSNGHRSSDLKARPTSALDS
ncbi:hypothetical protein DUI87_15921 [Hirundo rustica rustica]|uniref:Uncharacterized protein n=1 Tax=Hirundo rustica rustica TaxID=333673 RepID=A0A3M0K010_HIRRU|nr:hypothetical protein DUI87_15921 [Hirundo rustica rustica]